MKNNLWIGAIVFGVVALVGIIFTFAWEGNDDDQENDKLLVAASIQPLAMLAREVAGDDIRVEAILPAGASPHTYESTPGDLREIQDVDVIFDAGYEVAPWLEDLAAANDSRIVVLDKNVDLLGFEDDDHDEAEGEDDHANEDHDEEGEHANEDHEEDEHGHDHGDVDPHYWLSPVAAQGMVQQIAKELGDIQPENATTFQRRADAYARELDTLLSRSKTKIENLVEEPHVIMFHDAWNYWARDLGIEIVGTFEPNPGAQPRPQDLEELVELAEQYDLDVVFSEPQLSESVIKPFADEIGAKIVVLDPLGGVDGRESYLDLIEYNVNQLVEALR